MRPNLILIAASVCLVLAGREATAAIHFTDVNGGEVTVNRGSAKLRKPPVKANAMQRPRTQSVVTVTAGPDVSAAVNDYRRIQNAIDA
ncbi:MAG: hypothetical protein ABI837_17825, partial [Acidobacteriota bacterium]